MSHVKRCARFETHSLRGREARENFKGGSLIKEEWGTGLFETLVSKVGGKRMILREEGG